MLHTAIFNGEKLSLYRNDNEGRILPIIEIDRYNLSAETRGQWDILDLAIDSFLLEGEEAKEIHIEEGKRVEIDWSETQVETPDGLIRVREAVEWREVLLVNFSIVCQLGVTRQQILSTEQFTNADAQGALLALWSSIREM